MGVNLEARDITIIDVPNRTAAHHDNGVRLFRVDHKDTGRGLDLTSARGPRPVMCGLLGIAPSDLLLREINKISTVCCVTIDDYAPNTLVVTTLHRSGSDWATARQMVNDAIIRHLVPPKRPSLFPRLRRFAPTP